MYVDDADAFIQVEPHTIHSSDTIYVNVTPKSYTGDVDVIFGFDTDEVKPTTFDRNKRMGVG